MPIKPEHLDELLAGYEKPEDLLGEDGLFKQLKKALLERPLGAVLTHHLGYDKGDPAGRGTGNNRNGTYPKTVLTEDGSVDRIPLQLLSRCSRATKQSADRRVVVLGDSVMEGLTLETPERLSNLLEGITGVEHMNFATSQTFGPIQYLLAYETLAKKFDHDVVLI